MENIKNKFLYIFGVIENENTLAIEKEIINGYYQNIMFIQCINNIFFNMLSDLLNN